MLRYMKVTYHGAFSDDARRKGHLTKRGKTDQALLEATGTLWREIAKTRSLQPSPPTQADIEQMAGLSRAVWRDPNRSPERLSQALVAWGYGIVAQRTLMPSDSMPDFVRGKPFTSVVLGLAPHEFLLAAAAACYYAAAQERRGMTPQGADNGHRTDRAETSEILAYHLFKRSVRIAAGAFEVASKPPLDANIDLQYMELCRFWVAAAEEEVFQPDRQWRCRVNAFLAGAQGQVPDNWPPTSRQGFETYEGYVDGAIKTGHYDHLVHTLQGLTVEPDPSILTPVEYAVEKLTLRQFGANSSARGKIRQAANRLQEHWVDRDRFIEIQRRLAATQDYLGSTANGHAPNETQALKILENIIQTPPSHRVSGLGELDHHMGLLALIAHEAAIRSPATERVAGWIEWHLAGRWDAGEGPFMEPEIRDLASTATRSECERDDELITQMDVLRSQVHTLSGFLEVETLFGSRSHGHPELREAIEELGRELEHLAELCSAQ